MNNQALMPISPNGTRTEPEPQGDDGGVVDEVKKLEDFEQQYAADLDFMYAL